MAERRMFAKTIVTSDAFLDMPMSARCLYFTLGMFADDDGFVNSPKSIMRQVGATQDDLQILIAKKFLLVFESGVIVIKHWRINNYLRSDRYKATTYIDEKAELLIEDNGSYIKKGSTPMLEASGVPIGIPTVDQCETQDSIGKDSKGNMYGEFKNVRLKDSEYEKLKAKFPQDYQDRIEALSAYMRSRGKTYKDHYATILNWARKEQKEKDSQPKPPEPKKYKVFEKEDYEKDDFKAEQMPKELRDKLGGMFNAN